ncbi:hypothetical protein ZHAS_00002407 [Anopheles sinensis]|uniref:Uncharacterized protein n=1 Tax=Anopheles sinensis TaxID=74873 RepID=A0A084VC74_ANOSI|nr:hypothetical protein ZHAS_00002407 [Anopheles sinensis]
MGSNSSSNCVGGKKHPTVSNSTCGFVVYCLPGKIRTRTLLWMVTKKHKETKVAQMATVSPRDTPPGFDAEMLQIKSSSIIMTCAAPLQHQLATMRSPAWLEGMHLMQRAAA